MFFRLLLTLFLVTLTGTSLSQDLEEIIQQFNSGNTKEACQNISKFVNNHPEDPLAIYYLARLERRGENSLAYLEEVAGLLGQGKESELSQILMAQYRYTGGRYITAIDLLSRFKKENPKSEYMPQTIYLLGLSYLASDQIPQAQKEFESVLVSFGSSSMAAWAQLGLGDCQYTAGEYRQAAFSYQKVLDRYQPSEVAPLALSQMSRCYAELKDDSRAYLYLNLLSEKYPPGAIFPEAPVKEAKARAGAERLAKVVYTIQLGVFGSQTLVSTLVSRLKSKGYEPRTFTKQVEKKKYTVVQAGSFPTLEEAKAAKEKLEKELGGSYRVVIKE